MFNYLLFTSLIILILGGCGGNSSNSGNNADATQVRVSDVYVVGADVYCNDILHEKELPEGIYTWPVAISGECRVVNGTNDLNENSIADSGESFAPVLYADASYKNINPFTTLLRTDTLVSIAARYPKSSQHESRFDFDVVAEGKKELAIAYEAADAALQVAYNQAFATAPAPLQRIINGDIVDAASDKWRWVVSLESYGMSFCGGSLIANDWVLTAAHCVDGTSPGALSVRTKTYDLTFGGEIMGVSEIFIHGGYDMFLADNDIALVHLSEKVEGIEPVYLDRQLALAADTPTWVAGWGDTHASNQISNYPDDLHEVMVPLIDFSLCNAPISYDGELTENMFCAGYMEPDIADSCNGDSGGPLIIEEAGSWKLSGIVSFGGDPAVDGQFCVAENYPGVYTRVQNYIGWIEARTGALPLSGYDQLQLARKAVKMQTTFKGVQNILNGYLGEWIGKN